MTWSLVTGAAKGVGAEVCRALAQAGHSPVVHYRTSEAEAYQVVEECRRYGAQAEAIQGDFSTPETTADFITRYQTKFPETRHLVNNVGNYLVATGAETSLDAWSELFQTNLDAPFALINALLPSLKSHEGGIINIGVAGLESQIADFTTTAYTVTKGALWTLTRCLARELAPSLVTVNMVSPGHLERSVVTLDPSQLPMGRPGTLQELARVVVFLLAKENHYITGQNIEVAGGVRL